MFRHSSRAHNGQQSYEQLEFIGDAYLELFSTELIDATFGRVITPGRCAQVREQLVRNVTLAEYARFYELEERIAASDDVVAGRSKQDRTKVAADVFEAYVAGVIRADATNGLKRAAEWLRDLWAVTIRDQIIEAARVAGTSVGGSDGCGTGTATQKLRDATPAKSKLLSTGKVVGAKVRLAALIVVPKAVKITYKDERPATKDRNNQPLFHIGVYLDGWGERHRLLGTGSGLSKVEAGERAAEMALRNSKLMQGLQTKKAAFMAMKASAEEGEAEEEEGDEKGG